MAFEVLSPKTKLFEPVFYIEKCLYQSSSLRLFAVKRMHVPNLPLCDERPPTVWQWFTSSDQYSIIKVYTMHAIV